MPGPALTFPMQLDPTVRKELEAFLAQLNEGFLYIEHNEDGTHGDITARSIIVSGTDVGDAVFSGPLEVAQWIDITPIEDATDDAQTSANDKGWTEPRILLGLVRGPNLNPASDVGIRLRGTALSSTIQPDFTISVGYDSSDALSALVVTHMDTSQSAAAVNIPLKIGFNAALTSKFNILPDQRTESVDGVSLGAVDFGFGSNFHGFTNILGRTLYALNAYILGSPTTSGIRLDIDAAPGGVVLGVRLGDDSAYAQVNADILRTKGTTGYIQSESTKFYFGTSAATDVLMRKISSGAVAVRLGDDSDYGDLYARSLVLATGQIAPFYIIGTADTNGVRLKVDTGYLSIREGDDSAYAPLLAQAIISNSGYVQSASSYYYFGQGISADVLMRKTGAGTVAVRLGDDSTYGNLECSILHSVSVVQADTGYYVGPATTSGALLRLASGTPVLREGDDSDYNDLILRDLAATGTVSAATVTATGTVSATTVTASGTVSAATITATTAGISGTVITAPAGSTGYSVALASGAFGAGAIGGSLVTIGANSSGAGAAGAVGLQQRGGAINYLWSDNTSLIRVNGGPPSENGSGGFTDTAGTVVGDQTSSKAYKDILAERTDYATALGVILDTPVFDFRYKDGRYHNELFTGITTDDSPIFGKDGGKSFNEITFAGVAILAMKGLQSEIDTLRSELTALRSMIQKLGVE